jgi:serine/threonine protein kinase
LTHPPDRRLARLAPAGITHEGVRNPRAELPGYLLAEVIGRGGMGVVYRARQIALDREVAVKTIGFALAGDARFRARFLREARLAAALDHPHVVPVYDAGEADLWLFIAMRLVRGTDLARLLDDRPLAPGAAARILTDTAGALDAAHARGLDHRDVKPANILLEGTDADDARVYLSDFGAATDRRPARGLTSSTR